jgi:hypothetical protein
MGTTQYASGPSAGEGKTQLLLVVLGSGKFYLVNWPDPPNLFQQGIIDVQSEIMAGAGAAHGVQFSAIGAQSIQSVYYIHYMGASLAASVVPGSGIDGMMTLGNYKGGTVVNFRAFTAKYSDAYSSPLPLNSIDGAYQGSAEDLSPTSLKVENGAVSGNSGDCSLSGRAAPNSDIGVFDITLTLGSGTCQYAGQTLSGMAIYAHDELVILGRFDQGDWVLTDDQEAEYFAFSGKRS